jgi:hypothetical protein
MCIVILWFVLITIQNLQYYQKYANSLLSSMQIKFETFNVNWRHYFYKLTHMLSELIDNMPLKVQISSPFYRCNDI